MRYSISVGAMFLRGCLCFAVSLFISSNGLVGQSKKEQIEILNIQRDSLQVLLNDITAQLNIQKIKYDQNSEVLNTILESCKTENRELQKQISELNHTSRLIEIETDTLRQKVQELTARLDSLNIGYPEAWVLLRSKVEEVEDDGQSDCGLRDFFDEALNFPSDYEEGELYIRDVYSIAGFSATGLIAFYNETTGGACGDDCEFYLSLFNPKDGTMVALKTYYYGQRNELGSCNWLKKLKADRTEVFTRYGIVSATNTPVFYRSFGQGFSMPNKRIVHEVSGSYGRIYCVDNNGVKALLKEVDLTSAINMGDEFECTKSLACIGCFYNPLNSSQLYTHWVLGDFCTGSWWDKSEDFFITIELD
jgi:hypothetical protein